MKEFRCTRAIPYLADCPGRDDPRSRQGYYVAAEDERSALVEMTKRFPDDVVKALELGIKPFTARFWRELAAHG